jgi:hypothetical protein
MSVMVSSMIVRVRVSAMMRARSRRPLSGRVSPVGLWLSGIRYARLGANCRIAVSIAGTSQPSLVTATGTGRIPRVAMADSAPW